MATLYFNALSITFESVGSFQQKRVVVDETLTLAKTLSAKVHREARDLLSANGSFADTSGLVKATKVVELRMSPARSDNVAKVPPHYPVVAKQNYISGTVPLRAFIGTDGHVKSLVVIVKPDRSLTDAAVEAVRQWVYTPHLIDGEPAEVDAVISINFQCGG